MRFSRDRRGQSVVVGAVILFGFLILALGVFQVQVVPTDNANVEFEHSQAVEDDFGDLRNDVLRAGSTGSTGSTQVRLGTRYPARTFFVNPPPASGSLETEPTGEIRVRNASVGDGAHENARDFWNTSPSFETSSLRYDAEYNEFDGAPELVYEHSVVAAEFDDAVLLRTGQTVVSEGRVSLTALTGTVSESGVEPESVDPRAVSASDTTVPLTPTDGKITLELPTAVGNASSLADRWTQALPPNATATGNETRGEVQITLDNVSDDRPYRLALSEVSLDASGETEPAYVVPVGSQGSSVGDTVGVEVRDRYNNPVADATVSFDGTDRTTGDDGRAFFEPTESGSLTAAINGTAGPSYESVTFDVSAGGGGTGSRTFDVEWDDDEVQLPEGSVAEANLTVTRRDSGDRVVGAEVNTSYVGERGEITVSDDVTDRDGRATIAIESVDTQAGDEFDVYASAGDDVEGVPVRVTETGSVLEPVTVSSSDTELIFTMRNEGDTDVTVEQFAVDATGINSGITINDGNAAELEIRDSTVEGIADRNGNPDAFDADGQLYDLEGDSQGNQGQYATISPDDGDVTVDIRQFSERLDNGGNNPLEFTDSASDADVTVTFVLSDGSTEEFYLRQS